MIVNLEVNMVYLATYNLVYVCLFHHMSLNKDKKNKTIKQAMYVCESDVTYSQV